MTGDGFKSPLPKRTVSIFFWIAEIKAEAGRDVNIYELDEVNRLFDR